MPKSKERCQEIREEMRNTILRKSLLYFARNGFAGTKISDLSKNIGIGQGTIYVYFESKEELFQEILKVADGSQTLNQMKLLVKMPVSAKKKIRILSETIMKKLETDENFAAMIALNTQLLLEKNKEYSSENTTYQTELYQYTAKVIEQGQKEKSMVEGSSMKLADYYWGVVYLYSLKRLFTSEYEMISVDDLERTVLKG
ncbi:MAG: TetR/AcrR family transcriptional regulator [bacterium]|nr:TetR/AcrR family transcriptional regulator [bacterium]MDY4099304.1 TetR/AcrR family transcriptional regulator [Lachnospiraceae bacterium]